MSSAGVGRFWAIGVGPGDPELLTVKAVNILRRAAVIYHAGPHERAGRALAIIRDLVRPDQAIRRVLTAPMKEVTATGGERAYRAGVQQIAADCRRGLEVAFVTEGDPTVYSTAAHVWQLLGELAPEIPITIVPGVSSVTAAAARVGWPLGQQDGLFAIVPAGYHAERLHALVETFTTVCFLKVSSSLPRLVETLATFGPEREAVYVENLGGPHEWVTHDLTAALGRHDYFALALVRQKPSVERVAPAAGSAAGDRQRSPGKVCVVGLGPGDPRLLTPQALAALREAEVLVGYDGYLKMLAPLGLRAALHGSPLGAETERALHALELAQAGRRAALVSSGDAGVFGMAGLLLETAVQLPDVDIEVVPGVTAALAAAALLGAPLGHDFACLSLSDLLTPWDVIERRVEAIGQGDFVAALYNPVSQRRTWQLPRARDILLRHRLPQTPVGLVDKAYRPGTRVWHTSLGALTTEGVGMETLVIVGSSHTRWLNGRLVTPRGYRGRS